MVEVTVPFKSGGRILEVGGGNIPLFRPNLDMRELPTVDYVCDLEGKWPIEDESFDGVFGKFVIEHVSWRKVPHFVSECFRILKPGGSVMMVGPNTLEQCKEVAKIGDIAIESNSLLFGGQEEKGWNEHKAAFSPNYAKLVFTRAGFERIEVEPWPGQIWTGAQTDMIIKAWKSEKYPYIKGDRHEWIRDHVKASESIIDLGCGPTSIWEGRGYNIKTVDERSDFHPDIISKADSVPVSDKSFDDVILGDILEHYDIPSKLLNEAIRIAKKKIVITVPWEERWSKNLNPFTHHDHKVNYTQDILSNTLKQCGYDFAIEEVNVDIDYRDGREKEHWSWVGAVINLENKIVKEESKMASWYQDLDKQMQTRYYDKPPVKEKVKLNIGSFTVMAGNNWINTDILDMNQYAQQKGFKFQQFDATKGIPWNNDSVDCIVASHFLEHITRQEADLFLRECFRTMKSGGVIRIAVPDIRVISEVYLNPEFQDKKLGVSLKECFKENEGVKNAEDEAEALWNFITVGHKTAYDDKALISKIEKAGFIEVKEMKEWQSRSPEIKNETKDMYPDHTVYVEGIKPLATQIKVSDFKNNSVLDHSKDKLRKELYQQYLDGDIAEGKQ